MAFMAHHMMQKTIPRYRCENVSWGDLPGFGGLWTFPCSHAEGLGFWICVVQEGWTIDGKWKGAWAAPQNLKKTRENNSYLLATWYLGQAHQIIRLDLLHLYFYLCKWAISINRRCFGRSWSQQSLAWLTLGGNVMANRILGQCGDSRSKQLGQAWPSPEANMGKAHTDLFAQKRLGFFHAIKCYVYIYILLLYCMYVVYCSII